MLATRLTAAEAPADAASITLWTGLRCIKSLSLYLMTFHNMWSLLEHSTSHTAACALCVLEMYKENIDNTN